MVFTPLYIFLNVFPSFKNNNINKIKNFLNYSGGYTKTSPMHQTQSSGMFMTSIKSIQNHIFSK